MFDLNQNEEKVLQYWKERQIPEKVRQKNRGSKPFYFLDGPPFVSGDLHPGQMWVKTMKDVVLRYRRMRGYDVYDRAGYDVHGLPIEKRAEAQLGVTSKKEIETRIGVENFIKACRDYVELYIGRMDKDYQRFGISLDFSNPYIPSRMPYMEVAWSFMKIIEDKKLLYKDKRATTFCTNCGTSVSQGSVEVEYRNDNDPSIYVGFKVNQKVSKPRINLGSGDLYLLIWTTTPWTLPSNVSVAAHPDEEYVIAAIGGKRYIMMKERLDAVSELTKESAVVEAEFYGRELEGIYYTSPIEDEVPEQKNLRKFHRIILAPELVAKGDGSGLVHISPAHGLEDYIIGKKNHLPVFENVDTQGLYTKEAGKYAGLKVPAEANKKVIEDLKSVGVLVHSSNITHSYPHCWRCDTKLIFIATEQWFINIQKVKKKIINENRKVSWHPAEAQKWQEDVLTSSPDWAISRQRYWGIPMPIWRCQNGDDLVIGSLAQLRELAINKDAVDALNDLHRPHVDRIMLKCPKCSAEMKRIPDVLDVWFDSSIAYRASLTQEQFDKLFPMDYIIEGQDQLRGWFSGQVKMATIINGRRPFDNVGIDGMMLGQDGREMHKKLGNYVPLADILKTSNADAFRFWCLAHIPQLDLVFNMDKINEASRTLILLYNISNLMDEYSNAVPYKPSKLKRPPKLEKLAPEDAWIVSRLNSTIKAATEGLDNYEAYRAVDAIRSFVVTDLSRFYLKIAKKKILYADKRDAKLKLDLLNYIMYNTLVLLAPIIPFTAEKLYTDRYSDIGESVLLDSWPRHRDAMISADVERKFDVALDAVTAILNSREKSGMKLRWPLAKATVEVQGDDAAMALGELSGIIEDYTNVKKLEVRRYEGSNAEIRPAFARLGPDFKENAGAVANALKAADAKEISDAMARSGEYVLHTDKGPFTVNQNHFNIIQKLEKEDAVSFKYGVAYIDREISKELQEEALLREFERRVQLARKELGLKKGELILLSYRVSADLDDILLRNMEQLRKDVNAKKVQKVEAVSASFVREFEIEEEKAAIGIDKA